MSLKNLTEWKFNTNQSFSVKPRDGTSRDIMTDITFDKPLEPILKRWKLFTLRSMKLLKHITGERTILRSHFK
jgi:hypothetical protein